MGKDLVSVVVPIYNAEKYIRKCVESIINQTYSNMEVILINDGSKDNSGNICEEYKSIDHRVKVFHTENKGVSIARNIGIANSLGKYIQFVDADDYIETDMTERLVCSMIESDVDLVISGYKTIYVHGKVKEPCINYTSVKDECYLSKIDFDSRFGELYSQKYLNQLWNKMYLADIIKESKIKFEENVSMGEDLLFNLTYFKRCNNIRIIPDTLYNYMILNNKSLTQNFKPNYFENQQLLFGSVRNYLMSVNNYNGSNVEYIERDYIDAIVNCLDNLFHPNNKGDKQELKREIEIIINNVNVQDNIFYLERADFKKRFVGYLIKNRLVNTIYTIKKIKSYIKKTLK